jgi:NAD(P) transhydrogenase subunit alpha
VAATPAPVLQPLKLGYAVVVEPGAGEALNFGDQAYIDPGARVGSAVGAYVVLAVNAPTREQLDSMNPEDPSSPIAGMPRSLCGMPTTSSSSSVR